MANDGTVKIGAEIDEKEFQESLAKLGKAADSALGGVKFDIETDKAEAELKDLRKEVDDVSDSLKESADAADNMGRSYSDVGDIVKGVALGELVANGVQTAVGWVKNLIGEIWNLDEATAEYREAQGKLNTAFESAGMGPEAAKRAYSDFYRILGDTDTATEASQLLATLAENERDLSEWAKISAGVFGTFGDALPIEGLIESSNETAKTAKVTGVLADALNWAGISEDAFNDKLAALGTESERNSLIMKTLSETYDNASDSFFRNNEEVVKARENQILLDNALASVGETISTIKNAFLTEFSPAISDASEYLSQLADSVDWKELASGVGDFLDVLQSLVPIIAGAATAMVAYKAASSISGIIETLINATKNQTIAQAALNAVMNANPFVLVATLIAGVVTALTTLYLTNETFRNKVNAAWTSVKGTISNSIHAIVDFFTKDIPNAAQEALDWFLSIPDRMKDIGEDVVRKLWEGITGMGEWLRGKVDGFISGIISAVTGGGSKSSSSGGGSSRPRSSPASAPTSRMAAPANESNGNSEEGISLTASTFSRASAVRALESAIPAAQNRVSVATAAMAPASTSSYKPELGAAVESLRTELGLLHKELCNMSVIMDGRTVGRLISNHQNNMGRAFGTM